MMTSAPFLLGSEDFTIQAWCPSGATGEHLIAVYVPPTVIPCEPIDEDTAVVTTIGDLFTAITSHTCRPPAKFRTASFKHLELGRLQPATV